MASGSPIQELRVSLRLAVSGPRRPTAQLFWAFCARRRAGPGYRLRPSPRHLDRRRHADPLPRRGGRHLHHPLPALRGVRPRHPDLHHLRLPSPPERGGAAEQDQDGYRALSEAQVGISPPFSKSRPCWLRERWSER